MKDQVSIYQIPEKIASFEKDLGGVFSYADLHNLIGQKSPLAIARIIKRLTTGDVIKRIQRGIYVTKDFDPLRLSARLMPDSYISMDSVLSRNGLIGTVPEGIVSVVSTKRGREIKTDGLNIDFHSISKELFFGYTANEFGVKIADSEKAYLDLLYFYTKGAKFAIDPLCDVAILKLDKNKIARYLKKYKNSKFIKFVKGLIHEKS